MAKRSKMRYDLIDHKVDYEWFPDSPVGVLSIDILYDKFKKKNVMGLKFLNTTDKGIKSIFVSVECVNEDYETVYENDSVKMLNVNAKPHSEFGDGKFIVLGKGNGIKNAFVCVKKVIFSDETSVDIQTGEQGNSIMLKPPYFIDPNDPFYEKILLAAAETKIEPVFWYEKNKDYWRCTCGYPNKNEDTVCVRCLASRQWLDENFGDQAKDENTPASATLIADIEEKEDSGGEKKGEGEQEKPAEEKKTSITQAFANSSAADLYAPIDEGEKSKVNNKKLIRNILIFTPICVALCIGAFYLFMFRNPQDDKIVKYYEQGIQALDENDYHGAMSYFIKCDGYLDSDTYIRQIMGIYRNTIAAGTYHTVVLHNDGTVVAVGGTNKYGECDVKEWRDVYAVATGSGHTLGLKSDGTLYATGYNKYGQCDVSEWKDVVAVAAGSLHTVAITHDGQLYAAGYNKQGQCDVSEWKNIISVKAGMYFTVGLRADGTVVACGDNSSGQCDVEEWSDIIAIAAGAQSVIGLKSDGTVVTTGDAGDTATWTDIISVAAGYAHYVGLKSDGTVVAAGGDKDGCLEVTKWKDMVDVYAGSYHTIGLKSDGTLLATGWNNHGQCDVEYLGDIGLTDDALNFNIILNKEQKELQSSLAAQTEAETKKAKSKKSE